MSSNELPTVPKPAHTRSQSMVLDDPESLKPKRRLVTTEDVTEEWRSGSKTRVIKYYAAYLSIGLVVGGIIGVVVGLCIRFLA